MIAVLANARICYTLWGQFLAWVRDTPRTKNSCDHMVTRKQFSVSSFMAHSRQRILSNWTWLLSITTLLMGHIWSTISTPRKDKDRLPLATLEDWKFTFSLVSSLPWQRPWNQGEKHYKGKSSYASQGCNANFLGLRHAWSRTLKVLETNDSENLSQKFKWVSFLQSVCPPAGSGLQKNSGSEKRQKFSSQNHVRSSSLAFALSLASSI